MDIKLIFVTFLLFSSCSAKFIDYHKKNEIQNYQATFQIVSDNEQKIFVAIRSFKLNGDDNFIVVDPYSLKTFRKNSSELKIEADDSIKKNLTDSTYFLMLKSFNLPPYDIAGYGLGFLEDVGDKKFLTIDMCPSKKPFERKFFEQLVQISKQNNKPFPVGIAISGLWILNHEQEFEWILNNKKYLNIVWINHSFSHPYNPKLANEDNFLLMKNVDIDSEVFELEKLLIKSGEIPSIFFRFPGLISDQKLDNKINQYGLIVLSSDAWLAKGEEPSIGSVILIHGNSNEPQGIARFNQIIKETDLELIPLN